MTHTLSLLCPPAFVNSHLVEFVKVEFPSFPFFKDGSTVHSLWLFDKDLEAQLVGGAWEGWSPKVSKKAGAFVLLA